MNTDIDIRYAKDQIKKYTIKFIEETLESRSIPEIEFFRGMKIAAFDDLGFDDFEDVFSWIRNYK